MARDSIIVTLHMESNEVRMVAGQFYNNRLNILARKYLPTKGMDGIRITDKTKVAQTIEKAAEEISNILETPVEKVYLAIPTYRFHRDVKRINTMVRHNATVSYEDIRNIYSEGFKTPVIVDDEIINLTCNSYKINGLSYRKMPIGENGDFLEGNVELLCSDKMTTYDYIETVSLAGLKVVDICLDCLALAQETALFEQTLNSYALSVQLEREHIVYSLIYDGQLVKAYSDLDGYDRIIRKIANRYNMPYEKANTLLFKYTRVDDRDYQDRIITRWTNEKGEIVSVTYEEVQQTIRPVVKEMLEDIVYKCKEILKLENLVVYLSGAGAGIDGLPALIEAAFGREIKAYCPETLGLRDYRWSVSGGLFYNCKANQDIYDSDVSCIDMEKYRATLETRLRKAEESEQQEDITNKIKSFTGKLFNIHDNEGE